MPPGESYSVHDIITAAVDDQETTYRTMIESVTDVSDVRVRGAIAALRDLHRQFGDDEK